MRYLFSIIVKNSSNFFTWWFFSGSTNSLGGKDRASMTIAANYSNVSTYCDDVMDGAWRKFQAGAYLHWYQQYGCDKVRLRSVLRKVLLAVKIQFTKNKLLVILHEVEHVRQLYDVFFIHKTKGRARNNGCPRHWNFQPGTEIFGLQCPVSTEWKC